MKIHSLIRFDPDEIELWLKAFKKEDNFHLKIEKLIPSTHKKAKKSSRMFSNCRDINLLIERAKEEVYNGNRGETRPKSAQRKEKNDGAV